MSKHSPGPWKVCNSPLCKHGHVIDSDGEDVCLAAGANVTFIASAPTIAARLDEAVGLLRRFDAHPNLKGLIQLEKDVAAFLAAIDAESAGGR